MSPMRKAINFTSGNIVAQLVSFSIPIVLGELLQNLYNSVDALFVGNFVGKYGLAAVSVCSSISLLLIGFFNGMSAGVIAVVARTYGAGERDKLAVTNRVILTVAVILGVFLSALGVFLAPALLRLTAATGEIYTQGLIYLRIYLIGLMFTVIYNMQSGILRGMGNSSTPLRILIVSCVENILMDWLLLAVFDMGVAGAALATIISQGTSSVLAYFAIRGMDKGYRLSFGELGENRSIIGRLFDMGLPSGLQNSLISISNLVVWRYINQLGVVAAAGVGVAHKLDKFVSMPCKSFGLTMTSFISQNIGARNYKRTREGAVKCLGLSFVVTMSIGALVYIFARPLFSLFNPEEEVISVGVAMMHTLIPAYALIAVRESLLGVLRGHGKTRIPMILSLIGMVLIRQLYLAYSMGVAPRVENIYYCYPVAWAATSVMLSIYYLIVRKSLYGGEVKAS